MDEETYGIDEVVAIGYGTQRKRNITGAVSTVTAGEVNKIPVAGIDQALQGQVAGVMITQNYGAPGAGMQVRIRGIGTIGDSDPLYVIDGVPTKESINSLNTNDIESISILKDASAAAIYGARAANGVVLITTKKGTLGVTRVNFDAQYGVQQISNKLDLLDASEYAKISDEALVNDGKPAVWNNSGLGAGTDWQDVIFRNAAFHKYDLSVSSGNNKTRYLLGVGYFQQDGIVKFSDLTRYNIRYNLDSKISDKFTVGANINLSSISQNLIDTEINGVVRAAIFQPPTIPVYKADGSYAGPGANEGDAQNPLGMADRSDKSSKNNQLFGNLFAEYSLLPSLKFKTTLGLNVYSRQTKDFEPTFSEGNANRFINSMMQEDLDYFDVLWENTLSYAKEFSGGHQLEALAGNTLQDVKIENLYGYREGFANNEPYLQYLDGGSSNDRSRGNLREWSLASFYGRLNYSFADKYLVSSNIRYDGSSRFGRNNRWGLFPSASAGWRISKESFFKMDFIDDLKLRASWGQLGNQDIGLYAFSSTLSSTFYTLGSGQALNVGYAPDADFNPDVKWETTTQQNYGFDLSALNYRLYVSADYYVKNTTDMLLVLPQPMTSGFGTTGFENLGEVQNKGFEFLATWKNNVGDFRYSLSANLATLKNEVISLGERGEPITSGLFFDMSTRTEEGRSIREFFGYVTDGIFQNQQEITAHVAQPNARPGDVRFKDLNNDKTIDSKDRTFIGNPYPDFFYGMSASLGYKNFDLSLLFQGQQGNDIYNGTKFWLTNSGYNFNKGKQILARWTGAGTSNDEPRLTTNDPNQNARGSDRYIEDGSYLRLKNLQLGYTLPENTLKSVGISNGRLFFSGYNLLTFTGYSGYDPEVGASRGGLGDRTIGFDEVTYPQSKSYIIGLTLTF
jgi:TonB-dependent starch-binding outer membrane protein SusC